MTKNPTDEKQEQTLSQPPSQQKRQTRESENTTKQNKKLKANHFTYHFSSDTMENKRKIEEMQTTRDKLCKYLDENFENTTWLVETVKKLCNRAEKLPMMHEFKFHNTEEAVKHNTKVLRKYGYNFKNVVKNQKGTVLTPGSEFREVNALKDLWKNREDWSKIKKILKKGCEYPMGPDVPETTRLEDLKLMAERGNHKSAIKEPNASELIEKFEKEVMQGFLVPFSVKIITKIRHLSITPLGCPKQWSVNEQGERIPKYRPTHDCTFPNKSGSSLNIQILDDELDGCIFGQCLRRLLHQLHKLRIENPETIIYIVKHDLDAAYRRLHVHPDFAVRCTTILKDTAYLLLRLPFGVSAGPSMYSLISEAIFDLTNDLLMDQAWNPDTLRSPHHDHFQPPQPLDKNIKFGKANKLHVYVPTRETFCDGYIDDCVTMALNKQILVKKAQNALPLGVHSVMRPVHPQEPILRNDPLSKRKLLGEGTPSEDKLILGWIINTRTFRVYLPKEKYIAWKTLIDEMITSKNRVQQKPVESMIGKLNHAAFLLPHSRYFLNNLRKLQSNCEKYGAQHMNENTKNDLALWKDILKNASTKGVSINLLTYTEWDEATYTDACEHGIGGFNPKSGRAWRLQLPRWAQGLHINMLEFLASFIGLWIEIIYNKKEHARFLCMTDSSSSLAWLYKSNFDPNTQRLHSEIARHLATTTMNAEVALYSQHIPGCHNVVADSLSRDHHIDNNKLTFLLKQLYPTQAQDNFHILETLPQEISCWIESLNQFEIRRQALPTNPTRSKMGTLISGSDTLKDVVLKTTSWTSLAGKKNSSSCPDLEQLLEEISTVRQENKNFLAKQFEPPLATYVRPLGKTFGKIPSWNQVESDQS